MAWRKVNDLSSCVSHSIEFFEAWKRKFPTAQAFEITMATTLFCSRIFFFEILFRPRFLNPFGHVCVLFQLFVYRSLLQLPSLWACIRRPKSNKCTFFSDTRNIRPAMGCVQTPYLLHTLLLLMPLHRCIVASLHRCSWIGTCEYVQLLKKKILWKENPEEWMCV